MFALSQPIDESFPSTAMLEGKTVRLMLSNAAQRALAKRTTPLIAEMELYFSCLIRLRVRFYDSDEKGTATSVTDQLSIRFRPVMSRRCDLHEAKGKPPLDDFPITNRAPYIPHWMSLDYKRGEWVGEFGYTTENK